MFVSAHQSAPPVGHGGLLRAITEPDAGILT